MLGDWLLWQTERDHYTSNQEMIYKHTWRYGGLLINWTAIISIAFYHIQPILDQFVIRCSPFPQNMWLYTEPVVIQNLWLYRTCGYTEPVVVQNLWLYRTCGCTEPVVIQNLWLYRTCGCTEPVVVQNLWLYRTCGCTEPVLVQNLWLYRTCGCTEPVVIQNLWLYRTCGYTEPVVIQNLCIVHKRRKSDDIYHDWTEVSMYCVFLGCILK